MGWDGVREEGLPGWGGGEEGLPGWGVAINVCRGGGEDKGVPGWGAGKKHIPDFRNRYGGHAPTGGEGELRTKAEGGKRDEEMSGNEAERKRGIEEG